MYIIGLTYSFAHFRCCRSAAPFELHLVVNKSTVPLCPPRPTSKTKNLSNPCLLDIRSSREEVLYGRNEPVSLVSTNTNKFPKNDKFPKMDTLISLRRVTSCPRLNWTISEQFISPRGYSPLPDSGWYTSGEEKLAPRISEQHKGMKTRLVPIFYDCEPLSSPDMRFLGKSCNKLPALSEVTPRGRRRSSEDNPRLLRGFEGSGFANLQEIFCVRLPELSSSGGDNTTSVMRESLAWYPINPSKVARGEAMSARVGAPALGGKIGGKAKAEKAMKATTKPPTKGSLSEKRTQKGITIRIYDVGCFCGSEVAHCGVPASDKKEVDQYPRMNWSPNLSILESEHLHDIDSIWLAQIPQLECEFEFCKRQLLHQFPNFGVDVANMAMDPSFFEEEEAMKEGEDPVVGVAPDGERLVRRYVSGDQITIINRVANLDFGDIVMAIGLNRRQRRT
ncbi:hypothetical protein Acr_00g0044350 [Actinidia rufa]|uniref:Uncharacterized protein n=1 Tax=Actinidia rufa TaxID=165716 RepID=A0A7J0DKL5_9ERIC|nr:hypothetical protein Acr_00g0044350 [Actinidia rufa]